MTPWPRKKLGELVRIQNGFAFDSKKFSPDAGTPLIRIRDLKDGRSTETNYDGDFAEQYVVRAGDYLIGMDGEFGCFEWKGKDALLNQRVCRLHDFAPDLHPRFLFHGINQYLKAIEEVTTYTTVKHLSSKQIANIAFPLPPLPEQRRIAGILDELVDGIAVAVANSERNLANASELFESVLRSAFAQAEDWPKRTLREVATDFGRGKSKHRPRNAPFLYRGPYPFVQTGDVSGCNHIIRTYSQTYSEAGLAQSKLWPRGTVCISIVGAKIAETGILDFEACFPDSVIGVVVDAKKASAEYVEYMLQFFKAELREKGKGSARDNINLGTFDGQLFPIPDLKTQRSVIDIADSASIASARLEAIYSEKLEKLFELRQAVLHRAFQGGLLLKGNKSADKAAA